MNDKSSWWYWFKKLDGNLAECNNCAWVKDRGAARSTSILRCHLKTKHHDLFLEKLEADKLESEESAGKQIAKIKKRKISTKNAVAETDFDNTNNEVFINNTEEYEHNPLKLRRSNMRENVQQQLVSNVIMTMMDTIGMCNSASNNIDLVRQQYGTSLCSSGSGIQIEEINEIDHGLTNNCTGINTLNAAPPSDQPSVKLCRLEFFSAAHRLHNPKFDDRLNEQIYGKCNNGNGHGHNYSWKVVLEGPVDAQTGMVYNLSDLKREMAVVLEQVDHKNLDKDVPYFRDNGIVSTTENLAVFLYHELAAHMNSPELLKKVVLEETNKNSFTYSGKQVKRND